MTDHRVFQQWKCDPLAPQFEPITIVYAANGAGKSSLATLLHPPSSPEAWAAGVSIKVEEPGRGVRCVCEPSDPSLECVRVFDAGYVERSIRVKDGTADALLALGPDAVDRQHQREAAEERLTLARASLESAEVERSKAKGLLDAEGTAIAKEVAEVLRRRPDFSSYTRTNVVREMAEAATPAERASMDKTRLQALATSEPQQALGRRAAIPAPTVALESILDLLAEEPVTPDSLLAERTLAERDWIEQGAALHSPEDECKFCGGQVTLDRLKELANALAASRSDLVVRARDLRVEVDADLRALDEALRQLPAERPRLLPDCRASYDSAREALVGQCDQLRDALASASRALAIKCDDPSQTPTVEIRSSPASGLSAEVPVGWPAVVSDVFNKVVAEHDERCANFRSESALAAASFKRFVLGEHHAKWTRLETSLASTEAAVATADGNLAQARLDFEALAGGKYDLKKGVDWVNAELTRMTGRDDIRLGVAGDGEQYTITRDGGPVGGLSEGEKTALALVHFLGSLMNEGRASHQLCVVIDDPISSLDATIATGASAALWGELVARTVCAMHADSACACPPESRKMRVAQVLLFTHSFELFKLWSNQLDRLGAPQRKQGRFDRQLELRTRWDAGNGGTRRVPYWVPFGSDKQSRKRLRSEYHFLFDRCARGLIEVRSGTADLATHMEVQSLLPNAARRILESFLAYRRPEDLHKDFFPRLLAALPDDGDATTRTALRSHLNNWSHYEETAIDAPVERPDTPVLMQSVFSFIHHLDRDHFHRMCTSLQLEGWEHLLLPAGGELPADGSGNATCAREGCDFPRPRDAGTPEVPAVSSDDAPASTPALARTR